MAFLLIFFVSFLLFYPSLNYFFFRDDWFLLNWIRSGDVQSLLIPHEKTIYYRPLSMPLLFWSLYNLFGLDAFYFHLFGLVLFFFLIIAIYKLFSLLTNNKKISLIIALLYSTWPVHFMSLSWLVATQYILMPLFQIISFIFFIKFVKSKNNIYWVASFIFFIFGILSHEFTLMLPFIFFSWGVLINRKNLFKNILPFLFIDLLFLFFRYVIFPITSVDVSYDIQLNHLLLDNFLWYVVWAFNFPESFKDLVDQRFPIQSVKILTQYWRIVLPSLISILIVLNLIRLNLYKASRQLIFGTSWLVFSLLPIIAFVNHSYTMYLSFAGLGILLMIANLLARSQNYVIFIFIMAWITSSLFNLEFTKKTHWVVNEQAISKAYIAFSSNKIPNPEPNSTIFIKQPDADFSKKFNFILINDIDTLKQSLSNQNAMQVIYNDSTIESRYPKPLFPVENPSGRKVYYLEPTLENE